MSDFDWSNTKIFIVAPREMSVQRFTEIVKHYLPKGDIVLGISEEPYVVGFEDQPQFKMLERETVQQVIDKIDASPSPYKVKVLEYSQKDLASIVGGLTNSQRVLLVNGSWQYTFHNSEAHKVLVANNVPVKFISPFVDETEAREYEKTHHVSVELSLVGSVLQDSELFAIVERVAKRSYDYSFQVGAVLARKTSGGYEFIAATHNKVIPYETYALHHGNSREKHQSPPHDVNHYDTIHAEMQFLVEAARGDYSLDGATLFIDLLPCPNCARTLSQTNIDAIVYRRDHSDGYAVEILELCGKKVERMSRQ